MRTLRQIIEVGNSLGATLPSEILNAYGLHRGSLVELRATPDGLLVQPAKIVSVLFPHGRELVTSTVRRHKRAFHTPSREDRLTTTRELVALPPLSVWETEATHRAACGNTFMSPGCAGPGASCVPAVPSPFMRSPTPMRMILLGQQPSCGVVSGVTLSYRETHRLQCADCYPRVRSTLWGQIPEPGAQTSEVTQDWRVEIAPDRKELLIQPIRPEGARFPK